MARHARFLKRQETFSSQRIFLAFCIPSFGHSDRRRDGERVTDFEAETRWDGNSFDQNLMAGHSDVTWHIRHDRKFRSTYLFTNPFRWLSKQIVVRNASLEGVSSIVSRISAHQRRGRWVKSWPNATPNSSQHEPSYKIKTCIGGWSNDTAKSSRQLARKPFNCLTTTELSPVIITKQLVARVGSSWPRWPNGGKLGSSWAKIWAWSNWSQLQPTRANWVAKRYPTPSMLKTWLELGVPFGQGLSHLKFGQGDW